MKNSLKFVRQDFTDNSTIGEILVDGTHFCFYMEPTCRSLPDKIKAIPSGCYEVVMYESPRAKAIDSPWARTFDYKVPLLLKVPGHEYVECHPGNFPADTHDCFLPGYSKSLDYVGESDLAWTDLTRVIVSKLKIDKVFFEIIGGV